MTNINAALAWCPFPDRETARRICSQLLDENLIGCANLVGEIESLFDWEGERSSEHEIGVLLKTRVDLLERLVRRLGELHPYDAPAIAGWHCDTTLADTASWLAGLAPASEG